MRNFDNKTDLQNTQYGYFKKIREKVNNYHEAIMGNRDASPPEKFIEDTRIYLERKENLSLEGGRSSKYQEVLRFFQTTPLSPKKADSFLLKVSDWCNTGNRTTPFYSMLSLTKTFVPLYKKEPDLLGLIRYYKSNSLEKRKKLLLHIVKDSDFRKDFEEMLESAFVFISISDYLSRKKPENRRYMAKEVLRSEVGGAEGKYRMDNPDFLSDFCDDLDGELKDKEQAQNLFLPLYTPVFSSVSIGVIGFNRIKKKDGTHEVNFSKYDLSKTVQYKKNGEVDDQINALKNKGYGFYLRNFWNGKKTFVFLSGDKWYDEFHAEFDGELEKNQQQINNNLDFLYEEIQDDEEGEHAEKHDKQLSKSISYLRSVLDKEHVDEFKKYLAKEYKDYEKNEEEHDI